jgi:FKBP-type peptidyl-prolyl cis-trans isomerase
MSDTDLKFLSASAVHEADQAEILAAAVERAEGKVTRAQAATAAAKDQAVAAKADAKAQAARAKEAQAAFEAAKDNASVAELSDAGLAPDRVTVSAGSADGAGGTSR